MNLANQLGSQLCMAWGINPHDCQSIEIVFDCTQALPYAVATMLLNEQTIEVLMTLGVIDTEVRASS